MLSYLLDALHKWLPKDTTENLLELVVRDADDEEREDGGPWIEAIPIIFKSKTAWSCFGSLSFSQRSEWVKHTIEDLESIGNEEILNAHLHALALQPYCGCLLFYLIFDNFSDRTPVVQKAFKNATIFDFLVHMSSQEIDPTVFDVNKINKLKEKLNEEVAQVMVQVVDRMKEIARGMDPSEFILACNKQLIEAVVNGRDEWAPVEAAAEEMRHQNYVAWLNLLHVKGY